jgi:hypothetical protein
MTHRRGRVRVSARMYQAFVLGGMLVSGVVICSVLILLV